MTEPERFNHFPASPLISVTLIISGTLQIVPSDCSLAQAREMPALPQQSVMPPQDAPVTSWSAGEIAVLTIGVYPEAWQLLQSAGQENTFVEALAEAFTGMAQDDDVDTRWARFSQALGPIWHQARAASALPDWTGSTQLTDWTRSILGRTALAGPGRSLRAFERRLRRWSGQSRGALKFYAYVETLHRLAVRQPQTSLAALAGDAGYADQSHMGRAVRRATGFSPARLNHLIESHEAFWCYRLLGERF